MGFLKKAGLILILFPLLAAVVSAEETAPLYR